jgi:hypothetical protein
MFRLRRWLTETPLARRHARAMEGGARRRYKAIPWGAFRREAYPEEALALALSTQRMLAIGEYLAVDQFARAASAVTLLGCPIDLVAMAASIPPDEARHADMALRMVSLLSGKDDALDVKPEFVSAGFTVPMSEESLDAFMIEVAVLGETLACALLAACARRATDPTLAALYGNILRDEVHHARFGWYFLMWRAPLWSDADRRRCANRAGDIVAHVEERFGRGRDASRAARPAAKALGVLDSPAQAKAVRRVMQDEIVPALDVFGLGGSHAWRKRRQVRER